MVYMKNPDHSDSFLNYIESYLKNKPPDCILYSEKGECFKIHKEIFYQTDFMREILNSAKGQRESTYWSPHLLQGPPYIFTHLLDF